MFKQTFSAQSRIATMAIQLATDARFISSRGTLEVLVEFLWKEAKRLPASDELHSVWFYPEDGVWQMWTNLRNPAKLDT